MRIRLPRSGGSFARYVCLLFLSRELHTSCRDIELPFGFGFPDIRSVPMARVLAWRCVVEVIVIFIQAVSRAVLFHAISTPQNAYMVSLASSAFFAGWFMGAGVAGHLADTYGRKWTAWGFTLLAVLSTAAQVCLARLCRYCRAVLFSLPTIGLPQGGKSVRSWFDWLL